MQIFKGQGHTVLCDLLEVSVLEQRAWPRGPPRVPSNPTLPCGSVLCFCPGGDLQGLCVPFCVALGLQCAVVWGQQGYGMPEARRVSVKVCYCYGQNLCLLALCSWGYGIFIMCSVWLFFFVENAFFQLFCLCGVWMGAFGLCMMFLLVVFLLCWWMVVFFSVLKPSLQA